MPHARCLLPRSARPQRQPSRTCPHSEHIAKFEQIGDETVPQTATITEIAHIILQQLVEEIVDWGVGGCADQYHNGTDRRHPAPICAVPSSSSGTVRLQCVKSHVRRRRTTTTTSSPWWRASGSSPPQPQPQEEDVSGRRVRGREEGRRCTQCEDKHLFRSRRTQWIMVLAACSSGSPSCRRWRATLHCWATNVGPCRGDADAERLAVARVGCLVQRVGGRSDVDGALSSVTLPADRGSVVQLDGLLGVDWSRTDEAPERHFSRHTVTSPLLEPRRRLFKLRG